MICSDVLAENSNDRKLQGTEFYFGEFSSRYLPSKKGSWAFVAPKTSVLSL